MKLNLLTIIFVPFLLSCKYTCDEFPESEVRWVPYVTDDILSFTNNIDTINLKVTEHYRNEASSSRGIWMDYECFYEAKYETNKVQNYKIYERYGIGYNGGVEVHITDNDKFYFLLDERPTSRQQPYHLYDSIKVTHLGNIIIDNRNYSSTFLIEKDTIKISPTISWLKKSENQGVIQFYNRVNNQTWTKIN